MNSENSPSIIASAILGFCLITSVCLLRGPIKEKSQYVLKQEGPVFIRFSQSSGELCYTGIGPNGKFVTDSWLCLNGDKTKEGEAIPNLEKEDGKEESKDSKKSKKDKK